MLLSSLPEFLSHSLQSSDTAVKIQQLNELLVAEVCKRKLLEEDLEKERRQRDEYITDVIAQVRSLSLSFGPAHLIACLPLLFSSFSVP
jgi:hypothetical protein